MNRTSGCHIADLCATALVKEPEVRYKSNIRSIERVFDTRRGSIAMRTSTVAVDSRASEVGRIRDGLRGPGPGSSTLAGRQTGLPDRVRPGRRTGRGARPQARPDQRLPASRSLLAPGATVRACAPGGAARARIGVSTRWRLTERGIAVVLVSLAMIATAALAVVSLTALRVTSSGYAAGTGQHAAQR
jgi:hypothetical protein